MPDPFMTIITRHLTTRPNMLKVNQDSLAQQTDRDFEQVILLDSEGRGVAWANENLRNHVDLIHGEYVFLLDDDDLIATPNFIEAVKTFATINDWPNVIIVKMEHAPGFVLPDADNWQQEPRLGHIGCSGFIVRRETWVSHVTDFNPVYHGDYTFIKALWNAGYKFAWLDRVMTRTQRGQNFGKSENVHPVTVGV